MKKREKKTRTKKAYDPRRQITTRKQISALGLGFDFGLSECCGPFARGVTASDAFGDCFGGCCDDLCPPPDCCDCVEVYLECGSEFVTTTFEEGCECELAADCEPESLDAGCDDNDCDGNPNKNDLIPNVVLLVFASSGSCDGLSCVEGELLWGPADSSYAGSGVSANPGPRCFDFPDPDSLTHSFELFCDGTDGWTFKWNCDSAPTSNDLYTILDGGGSFECDDTTPHFCGFDDLVLWGKGTISLSPSGDDFYCCCGPGSDDPGPWNATLTHDFHIYACDCCEEEEEPPPEEPEACFDPLDCLTVTINSSGCGCLSGLSFDVDFDGGTGWPNKTYSTIDGPNYCNDDDGGFLDATLVMIPEGSPDPCGWTFVINALYSQYVFTMVSADRTVQINDPYRQVFVSSASESVYEDGTPPTCPVGPLGQFTITIEECIVPFRAAQKRYYKKRGKRYYKKSDSFSRKLGVMQALQELIPSLPQPLDSTMPKPPSFSKPIRSQNDVFALVTGSIPCAEIKVTLTGSDGICCFDIDATPDPDVIYAVGGGTVSAVIFPTTYDDCGALTPYINGTANSATISDGDTITVTITPSDGTECSCCAIRVENPCTAAPFRIANIGKGKIGMNKAAVRKRLGRIKKRSLKIKKRPPKLI